MAEEEEYTFGPFRLNATREQLWRANQQIHLPPKVFAVLRYLVEHPNELVTKNTFFESIWPGLYVTDTVLAVHIGKAREALDDDPQKPAFIETVHRRGYRFIAACRASDLDAVRDPDFEGQTFCQPLPTEPATTIGSQPLVGRDVELALLREKLDVAVSGRGSLLFISGPAGIGKTRLARELRNCALKLGCRWLEGRYDKANSQPYQAWVEIIRSYLQQTPGSSLESLEERYRRELTKLVPEIAAAPSESIRNDRETERLMLFEGVTQLVFNISRKMPLVLLMDDLQWAASLELLHHLARNIGNQPVLIVATYRDDELKNDSNLWRTILAMNRERLFYPLPLVPLGVTEVEKLISSRSENAIAAQLAVLVHRKTQGNPFFVEEVLHLLQQRRVLFMSESGWQVTDAEALETPESVKAVINERLEWLGNDAEELLRMASVIGREFPLRVLRELMGKSDEGLIEILDRCEGAGLILSQKVRGEEIYSFTHDIMQEALYDSIGPARRRRHHLRVGHAIEKLYSSRLEEWYDALGRHFIEGNELEKALEYSLKAGDRASAICSWGRASAHYQMALELLQVLEVGPRHRAEVLEKLALATMWFGKGKDSLEYWEEALSVYEALGDAKKAGAVHLRLYQQYYSAMGTRDREKGYRHSVEALGLLEPEGDSVELAQAYTRSGLISAHRQNVPPSAGIAPLEKGLALAHRLGDAATLAEAEMSLAHVLVYHVGEIKSGLELAHAGYEAAKKSGETVLLAETALRVAEDYVMLLDADRGWRWAEEAINISTRSGAPRHQILSSLLIARAYILRGDGPQALLSLETARQIAKRAGVGFSQIPRPPIRFALIMVPFYLGDWDECASELSKWQDWPSDVVTTFIAWISGWLSLEKADLAGAQAQLREAVTRCEARGEKTLAVAPLALLSEAASRAGQLREAAVHLRRAQEITSQSEHWCGLLGEVFLAEGILFAAEKRWEKANRAFHEAVEIHRRYHLPYYEARVLFEWAEMHLSRRGAGDRKQGKQLLNQSLDIFQKIQAKKMVEKTQALKHRLGM
jgi:DNA-binding winged helix-turn-helix (wHTH) protein/tetratricopeptide (TPR) repeat protein